MSRIAPLIALTASFIVFRTAGWLGWSDVDSWHASLQAAVVVMLLLTASAHWGSRRRDLIRMVPPGFPYPAWIVSVTGVLEISGAIGLLVPALSLAATICLVVLLIAMFPANVYAARERLTIGGRPVPKLVARSLLQVLFIAAIVLASPLLQ